jgi:hypothetical protein
MNYLDDVQMAYSNGTLGVDDEDNNLFIVYLP